MAAIALALAPSARADDYLYPLKLRPILTGNFGEYRINHPHGGVDLGTDHVIGVPVLAADDGRVVRVRASSGGYGRAVYLQHADGRQTVYAHLSEFGPKLKAVADAARGRSFSYGFQKFFSGNGPHFARGEVIGYSGMTGTDVPHLHFEVRRGGLPVNPQRNGLPLADGKPPVVERLYIEPMDAGAHVDGRFAPAFFDFADGRLDRVVTIGGRVSLQAQVTDYIENSERTLAPYSIRLTVDDAPMFYVRYDQFDYADQTHSELDYNYRLKEEKVGVFHRLHRKAARTIFQPENLSGDLSRLTPGDHTARIVASDAAGNIGEGLFTLRVVEPMPAFDGPAPKSDGPRTALPDTYVGTHEKLFVAVLGPPSTEPISAAVCRLPDGKSHTPVIAPTGDDTQAGICRLPSGVDGPVQLLWDSGARHYSASGAVHWVRAGARLDSPDGKATMRVASGAVYEAFPTLVTQKEAPAQPGLEPVSPLYSFERSWEPLHRKLSVSVQGATGRDIGVFLLDRGTYWFMGRGPTITPTHLGDFALMRDTQPPSVGEPRFEMQRNRYVLLVPYQDNASGVSDGGIWLAVDGRRVLAEPMPVSELIRYRPDEPLSPGVHRVEVRLTDRAGNSNSGKFDVNLGAE
ncbi:M23 family metallopeptidase [bacterium]|nr:M23 family metallopeptidase [bacterium]